MGIPLVAMSSPYEANFTNLIDNYGKDSEIVCSTSKEYCLKIKSILGGYHKSCPQTVASLFVECFTPQSLTCSSETAKFAKDLDL